jgi:hypothetical protein
VIGILEFGNSIKFFKTIPRWMKNVILKLKNLVIEKNNKKKKTHKISEFKFKKKIKYSLYNIEILHYKERKKIHSITCE